MLSCTKNNKRLKRQFIVVSSLYSKGNHHQRIYNADKQNHKRHKTRPTTGKNGVHNGLLSLQQYQESRATDSDAVDGQSTRDDPKKRIEDKNNERENNAHGMGGCNWGETVKQYSKVWGRHVDDRLSSV